MSTNESGGPAEDLRHEPARNRFRPMVAPTADKMPDDELTLDHALAQAIRDEGVGRSDAGTDDWWKSCCDAAIEELARRGEVFQAADLLELGVTEPDSPNRWGPRLLAAARNGVIVPVGYAASKRPTTACSAVRLWRGAR